MNVPARLGFAVGPGKEIPANMVQTVMVIAQQQRTLNANHLPRVIAGSVHGLGPLVVPVRRAPGLMGHVPSRNLSILSVNHTEAFGQNVAVSSY